MSRCEICNVILSEQELTNKDPLSGTYTSMCFECLDIQEKLMNDEDSDALYVSGVETTDDGDFDEEY